MQNIGFFFSSWLDSSLAKTIANLSRLRWSNEPIDTTCSNRLIAVLLTDNTRKFDISDNWWSYCWRGRKKPNHSLRFTAVTAPPWLIPSVCRLRGYSTLPTEQCPPGHETMPVRVHDCITFSGNGATALLRWNAHYFSHWARIREAKDRKPLIALGAGVWWWKRM